jgi:GPI-anchor transamidase subunit GAA1
MESLCRSLNNLLEHLHQSFFFYFLLSAGGKILGEPGRFVSIGTYLPAAMIIAASFTITAIALWVVAAGNPVLSDRDSKSLDSSSSSMSITYPLGVVISLHGAGFAMLAGFDLIERADFCSMVLPLYSFLRHIGSNYCIFGCHSGT